MTHKPLPTDFSAGGFHSRQLMRGDKAALYRRAKPGSEHHHYEVIRIKRHDGYTIKGNAVEPAEFYPGAESWGTDGWTFEANEYDRAKAKFDELEGRQ